MNGLSIDCAISKLTISAKCEEKTVSAIFDIGMKQSETLLPVVDYVLKSINLKVEELNYITLTIGPGSFTGLRLGLSCAKAISLAYKIPIYSVNTLDLYAKPFFNLSKDFIIVSELDAKKDRFYFSSYFDSKQITDYADFEPEKIAAELLKKAEELKINKFLICGPESERFAEILKEEFSKINNELSDKINIIFLPFETDSSKSLFKIAEEKIQNNEKALSDYDGPVYIRASEAEVKLQK